MKNKKLNLRHQSSASANPKSKPSLYPVTVEHVESLWKLNAAKPEIVSNMICIFINIKTT